MTQIRCSGANQESFSHQKAQNPTWREEAVEVADDGAERGPERGLVVHAARDQVGQFCPLWGRELVVVGVEQRFLGSKVEEMNKASVLCSFCLFTRGHTQFLWVTHCDHVQFVESTQCFR